MVHLLREVLGGLPCRPSGVNPPEATTGAMAEAEWLSSVTRAMTVGQVLLKPLASGVITPSELSGLTHQQDRFARVEQAPALRLGRFLDQGELQLGSRPTASKAHLDPTCVNSIMC